MGILGVDCGAHHITGMLRRNVIFFRFELNENKLGLDDPFE